MFIHHSYTSTIIPDQQGMFLENMKMSDFRREMSQRRLNRAAENTSYLFSLFRTLFLSYIYIQSSSYVIQYMCDRTQQWKQRVYASCITHTIFICLYLSETWFLGLSSALVSPLGVQLDEKSIAHTFMSWYTPHHTQTAVWPAQNNENLTVRSHTCTAEWIGDRRLSS
jgi:hypothetical protein